MQDKFCLALDGITSLEMGKNRIKEAFPYMNYFKVGLENYLKYGNQLIDYILEQEKKVFLDLKFFDIPNTVYEACKAASNLGVHILNVHGQGGKEMLHAAYRGVQDSQVLEKPKLIGVTVLTSVAQSDYLEKEILSITRDILSSNFDGIVCSAKEVQKIKAAFSEEFFAITPGIRFSTGNKRHNDQKRVLGPREALEKGSDLLVIGRMISSLETEKERLQGLEKLIRECA